MAVLSLSLLFASTAFAHSGLKSIVVDGTSYPPFNGRIDNSLDHVRRIEWSHDLVVTPFNPITNFSDPALACQPSAKVPVLKAPIRAGAKITFNWTPIVKMHSGPIMAYMGMFPSFTTKPQDVKFFKIWERGFDAAKDQWGNQIAVDEGNTYTVQIPSDIKSGTYVVRTELLALHGNMENLREGPLAGPQSYPYCINVDVIGSGSATPDGVTFPGAYKLDDFGIKFQPYQGPEIGKAATEQNAKYVCPGPAVYKGKFDAPTGAAPVVTDTGAYTGKVKVLYDAILEKLDVSGEKLSTFVNSAWSHYMPNKAEFKKYPAMIEVASKERKEILKEALPELKEEMKKENANTKQATKRFVA